MEQKAEWYNDTYKDNIEYKKEPEQSIYYPVWEKALSLINNERIIDFGCGPGQFARLMIKSRKRYVIGMDFSKEAINMAIALNPKHPHKFVVRNLLKGNKFPAYDLVVCFEVLEHIVDDLAVISKIIPGKRFIFSVPNYDAKSHVRIFSSEAEVFKRYSELVDIKYIYPITVNKAATIYLVNSVKL